MVWKRIGVLVTLEAHFNIRRTKMTIKEFIKSIQETFGDNVEFKATSSDGKIYRSLKYEKEADNVRRGRGTNKKAHW